MTSEKPKRSRRKLAAVAGAVLVVLLGGGYVAAYAAAGDELPTGTSVAGIGIGGQTRAQAVATLEDRLAGRLDQPITVTVGGRTTEVAPQDLGLAFDAEATVDQGAAGRSWDPRELWAHYTDGQELDPVVAMDDAAVERLADGLDELAGTPAVDGRVRFRDGAVETSAPKTGRAVDRADLAAALGEAYLAADRTAEVRLTTAEPRVDAGDVEAAVADFAEPAMSGPVTLSFGSTPVELTPERFSSALRMVPVDGRLEPEVAPRRLRQLLSGGISADARKPVDATVVLRNGKPTVVPAKPGVTFDQKVVQRTFLELLTRPQGERTAEIDATVAEPETTTEEAEKLGIEEQVSMFTTYYPYAEYRNVNIGRAAELVDGTVLAPGETFSLNETVGERTAENGFTAGWIIADGIFRSELGGGVSQMATTLYNAAFFAGLEDVEHKPHSLYISRYPVGREATVAWPTVDLRFRNNTDHGVLISARVTPATGSRQGVVTVRMYSTKTWDITTRTSPRYAFTSPATRTVTDGNCEDTSGASGFSVDVWRYFHEPGESAVVRTEKQTTTYIPQDEVVCWEGGVNPNPRPQSSTAGGDAGRARSGD